MTQCSLENTVFVLRNEDVSVRCFQTVDTHRLITNCHILAYRKLVIITAVAPNLIQASIRSVTSLMLVFCVLIE